MRTVTERHAVKTTRGDALFRELADDIVSGRLTPGIRLDEQRLAARFAVSRTPVREALRHLAATGLAEKRPHKGVVVTSISRERVVELFEVMAELEASCAHLAATRMTAIERMEFDKVHARARDAVAASDVAAYEGLNRAFHDALYRGSHNATLAELTRDTRRRLAPFRRAQFRLFGRVARSFAEHEAVLAAVRDGDGERARRAMHAHMVVVGGASADYVAGRRAAEAAPEDPGTAAN